MVTIEEQLRESLDDCLLCNKNLFGIIDECKRERDEARASVADAYRRGAEAMRETCAVAGQEACRNYIACGEVVAETLRALPVPEEEETTDEA